jgi:hypothetical protein
MIDVIFFWTLAYFIWTANLAVLTAMIKDGYFNHPIFTRSIRAVFMLPPFSLVILFVLFLKESISENFTNFVFVMKKRKD